MIFQFPLIEGELPFRSRLPEKVDTKIAWPGQDDMLTVISTTRSVNVWICFVQLFCFTACDRLGGIHGGVGWFYAVS